MGMMGTFRCKGLQRVQVDEKEQVQVDTNNKIRRKLAQRVTV